MTGNQVRLAARIARREVRRHPWRHLLVVALIFVPGLTVVALFSAADSFKDLSDRADAFATAGQSGGFGQEVTLGAGSTVGFGDGDLPTLDRSALPEGTIVEDRWTGADWFVTDRERADGEGPVLAPSLVLQAPEGSMASARAVVRSGRLPRSVDEVALSPALAEQGGWDVGDEVASARADRSFEVVGIAVPGDRIDTPTAFVGDLPESYWSTSSGWMADIELASGEFISSRSRLETGIWLPAGVSPEVLWVANATRVEPTVSIDDRLGLGFAMAAAGVGAIVAVVASAAFALAARRQLRSVGLLATAGADPATIRASLVLQGALPGLVAGILAGVAGLGLTALIGRWGLVQRYSEVEGAVPVFSWTGAGVALALGVGAGVAAAWQPAATASRIPLLSALAGRRPVGPVRSHVPLTGLALWVVGACLLAIAADIDGGFGSTAQPFLAIGGIIAVALGGVGLAPLLVAIVGRGAAFVGGSMRMVLRGLVRHRTQSAATVAAVGVALALPVGLLTFRAGEFRNDCCEEAIEVGFVEEPEMLVVDDPEPAIGYIEGNANGPAGRAALARVLEVLGPEASAVRGVSLVDDDGEWVYVAEVDERALPILQPWAAEALEAGRAVATDPDDAGPLALVAEGRSVDLEAVPPPDGEPTLLDLGPADYLVSSEALDGVGSGRPSDWTRVVRPRQVATEEFRALAPLVGYGPSGPLAVPTLEQVQEQLGNDEASVGLDPTITVWFQGDFDWYDAPGPQLPGPQDGWTRALLAMAFIGSAAALLVLTITLSLRAVDGRDDRRAAVAAGAPPALLRRQQSMEGAVLAGLGALLALPLGWIPIAAVRASTGGDDNVLPGWELVPILAVPVVLVTVLWWVFPALGAVVRERRGRPRADEVLPRW